MLSFLSATIHFFTRYRVTGEKTIVLLDVDQTLIIYDAKGKKHIYNEKLIEELVAFAKNKDTIFYLFTNMSVNTVSDDLDGPTYFITRPQLVEYLKSKRITIAKVVTPLDLSFGTPQLGRGYTDFYEKYYQDPTMFIDVMLQEVVLRDKLQKAPPKPEMFSLLIDHLSLQGKELHFIYYDDGKEHLESVMKKAREYQYEEHKITLSPMLVNQETGAFAPYEAKKQGKSLCSFSWWNEIWKQTVNSQSPVEQNTNTFKLQ